MPTYWRSMATARVLIMAQALRLSWHLPQDGQILNMDSRVIVLMR